MLSAKTSKSLKIAEYPLDRLTRLESLDILIALSNPNIDIQILAQGYCVAIVIEQDEIRKALSVKQETE